MSLRTFDVVVPPVATRSNMYLTDLSVALAGTVALALTVPFEHEVVVGNPATTGVEDRVQLVALVTVADKDTDPPVDVIEDGVATKDEIVGLGLPLDAPAGVNDPRIVIPPTTSERTAMAETKRPQMVREFTGWEVRHPPAGEGHGFLNTYFASDFRSIRMLQKVLSNRTVCCGSHGK